MGSQELVGVSFSREGSTLMAEGNQALEHLSKTLNKQLAALADKEDVKVADLTGRNGLAQATKTLADAASTVYGWGEGSIPGLIVVGEISRVEPQPAKITEVRDVPPIDIKPVVDGPAPAPKPALGAGPVEDQAEVVRVAGKT